MSVTGYDRVLHGARQVHKLRAVPRDADQQVFIILRVLLSLIEQLVRYSVKLHVERPKVKERAYHSAEVSLSAFCAHKILVKAQVQKCAAGVNVLIQFRRRPHSRKRR